LTDSERARSRVLILDQAHRVLAASDGRGVLTEIVQLDVSAGPMGCYTDKGQTIGYALTPGYETYAGMGWYGCVQQLGEPAAAGQIAESAAERPDLADRAA
jgi:hypothetical protein